MNSLPPEDITERKHLISLSPTPIYQPEEKSCASEEFLPGSLPLKDKATLEYVKGISHALKWFEENIDRFLRSEHFPEDTQRRADLGFIKRHIVQREQRRFDEKRLRAGFTMADIHPDEWAEYQKLIASFEYEQRLKKGEVISGQPLAGAKK